MKFNYNDGRAEAGYKGDTGDCVARSIAIATGLPYQEVYDRLAEGNVTERKTKRSRAPRKRTAADGIHTNRKWFKDYMTELGFEWIPTMKIGQGCKVHLTDGELPNGRLVVAVSKHFTAVIDGEIHDTYDPQRETHYTEWPRGQELKPGQWRNEMGMICGVAKRCVYGYYRLKQESNNGQEAR